MGQPTLTDNGHAHNEQNESGSQIHAVRSSRAIHRPQQKSQTLNRRFVRREPHVSVRAHVTPTPASEQSPPSTTISVSKFAKHPSDARKPARVISDFSPAAKHPSVVKAEQRLATAPSRHKQPSQAAPRHTPSQVIKRQAIDKALHDAPSRAQIATRTPSKPTKEPRINAPTSRKARIGKFLSVASASLAILLLGGYFTYLYMPNVSVRVAATQSGVNAKYPSYRPTGYSLDGPIAYSAGEVKMKFAANAGPKSFAITQSKSSWDSSAVLENYVKPKAENGSYVTTRDNGLTVYTFANQAVWVNDGVFFTITGDAPLTGDQIRRVATSM